MAFRLVNLIEKKRSGQELADEEIEYFVRSVSNFSGASVEIADPCQVGAMLMAVYLKGFTSRETHALTGCMQKSGRVLTWPDDYKDIVVDKHSTGGVGDKVSLVLAPALAAVGLKVPMISGRSLGHTGGTLNKLESIPGYKTELSYENIQRQLKSIGCCIVGQTEDIVPADKVLYRCRDLTATVNHKSLITASIVSKKLAEGISALVYDVKFGNGSLFKDESDAVELAKMLVSASAPKKCSALLTSMDCPLGNTIGNSLEVKEAVDCLRGFGPNDVMEVVEALGAELLYLTNAEDDINKAKERISEVIKNGDALEKFREMIMAQGVDRETAIELCHNKAKCPLKHSLLTTDIIYNGPPGYVQAIDAKFLGEYCTENLSACVSNGLTIKKHVGEKILKEDAWLVVHHQDELSDEHVESLCQAIKVGPETTKSRKRIYKRVVLNEGEVTVFDVIPSSP